MRARGGPTFRFVELEMLANLDAANHTYNRLISKLTQPFCYMTEFKLHLKLHNAIQYVGQLALWPHDMFSSLYHKYPLEWASRIVPDVSRISAFWNSLRDMPLLENHCVKGRRNWTNLCIPISLHGDGVPIVGVGRSWSKSLEILSWASCIAQGSTLGTFNYICSVFAAALVTEAGRDTLAELFRVLAWSLRAMYNGKHPERDWNNKKWPHGSYRDNVKGTNLCGEGDCAFFGMVVVIRGDLDWKFKTLGLRNYNRNDEPCNDCKCDTGRFNWLDFRRNAAHRDTIWTAQAWRAAHPNPRCCLFLLPFISILTQQQDFMHVAHLGVYQYMYGSILWLLAFKLLHGSPTENMKVVMAGLRAHFQGALREAELSKHQAQYVPRGGPSISEFEGPRSRSETSVGGASPRVGGAQGIRPRVPELHRQHADCLAHPPLYPLRPHSG